MWYCECGQRMEKHTVEVSYLTLTIHLRFLWCRHCDRIREVEAQFDKKEVH